MKQTADPGLTRREFVAAGAVLAAAPALTLGAGAAGAAGDKAAVLARIPGMHDANVKRLQEWIALPSIAAENRNYPQGPEYMAQLARDAGFSASQNHPDVGQARSLRQASMPGRAPRSASTSCTT